MPTTEEILSEVAATLSAQKDVLADIKTRIELCERLPTVNTSQLLNLPLRINKVVVS